MSPLQSVPYQSFVDRMVSRSKIAWCNAHTSSALSMQSCQGGFLNASSIQDLGPMVCPQTANEEQVEGQAIPFHDCCPGSMPK